MDSKELTLEITNKCNVNCPWCSSSSTPNGKDMPLERLVEWMEMYKDRDNGIIRLSGGEPTLHYAFREVLAQARTRFRKIVLLTSGNFTVDIRYPIKWEVNEYVVHVCNSESLLYIANLRDSLEKNVSMQIVMVKGNEYMIGKAISYAMLWNIPIRLLYLQKQGRGINCEPLNLLSWTGDKGCREDNKVTVTHDNKVVSCSALKYKEECDWRCLGNAILS